MMSGDVSLHTGAPKQLVILVFQHTLGNISIPFISPFTPLLCPQIPEDCLVILSLFFYNCYYHHHSLIIIIVIIVTEVLLFVYRLTDCLINLFIAQNCSLHGFYDDPTIHFERNKYSSLTCRSFTETHLELNAIGTRGFVWPRPAALANPVHYTRTFFSQV